jgi:hypothetical protein
MPVMKPILPALLLLTLASCATTPNGHRAASDPDSPCAPLHSAQSTEPDPDPTLSTEARLLAGMYSKESEGTTTLKASYPNKAALVADLQAVRPRTAVALDGKTVCGGFGPPMSYHTGADQSISR